MKDGEYLCKGCKEKTSLLQYGGYCCIECYGEHMGDLDRKELIKDMGLYEWFSSLPVEVKEGLRAIYEQYDEEEITAMRGGVFFLSRSCIKCGAVVTHHHSYCELHYPKKTATIQHLNSQNRKMKEILNLLLTDTQTNITQKHILSLCKRKKLKTKGGVVS